MWWLELRLAVAVTCFVDADVRAATPLVGTETDLLVARVDPARGAADWTLIPATRDGARGAERHVLPALSGGLWFVGHPRARTVLLLTDRGLREEVTPFGDADALGVATEAARIGIAARLHEPMRDRSASAPRP